jgi:hypothetical protein
MRRQGLDWLRTGDDKSRQLPWLRGWRLGFNVTTKSTKGDQTQELLSGGFFVFFVFFVLRGEWFSTSHFMR